MNAAKQATWLFFAMIALACSGWYFASRDTVVKLDEQTLATTADSVVIGLTVRQFDAKGSLANFLESPEMQHIPEKNTNLFKSPHIVLAQENQPAWDIRSEKAQSINKGEQITFIKKVIIHQGKDAHTEDSTFKTEELTYFPKQKFATTALAIVFEQAGSIVHSTGMNAYLNDKHIELLGKAHATYQPKHA
ncbi:MAG: LPS export ABC transporter periplasmic protein LptC [Legionella sp.]|nr:LPS export ABC transporter periplasmic protein LptC [Legionella sp.]